MTRPRTNQPGGKGRGPEVRSLPLEQWPAADRAAWEAACAPGVRLRRGGAASHLAPITRDDLARRYGYFLDYLERMGRLNMEAAAGSQITPQSVEGFVEELKPWVSSVTLAQTLYKVRRAGELIAPGRPLGWLKEMGNDLAAMAEPRSRAGQVVDVDRLLTAGLALVAQAEISDDLTPMQRARMVRNGLMVAMLAVCPIRLKNFAALELGRSFVDAGDRWAIVLDRRETKSHRHDERGVPEALPPAVESYLTRHRPVLLGDAPRVPAMGVDADDALLGDLTGPLWVESNFGTQMSYSGVEEAIAKTTLETVGTTLRPHMFRTCCAGHD